MSKKMIDIEACLEKHGINVTGIVHAGAHTGEETEMYARLTSGTVVYIEAHPDTYLQLKQKLEGRPNFVAVNCAACDKDGPVIFRKTSVVYSSSILPLKEHLKMAPKCVEIGQVKVEGKMIDTILKEMGLHSSTFNFLNLDTQGAELMVLKGASNLLPYIQAINTEVNMKELYEGCVLIKELDAFLEDRGFIQTELVTPFNPSWGDAFYVRKNLVG